MSFDQQPDWVWPERHQCLVACNCVTLLHFLDVQRHCHASGDHDEGCNMDTTTLLIIILLVLVLFGGGWYGRRRWHGRRRY